MSIAIKTTRIRADIVATILLLIRPICTNLHHNQMSHLDSRKNRAGTAAGTVGDTATVLSTPFALPRRLQALECDTYLRGRLA